jgi:hypothetical protein
MRRQDITLLQNKLLAFIAMAAVGAVVSVGSADTVINAFVQQFGATPHTVITTPNDVRNVQIDWRFSEDFNTITACDVTFDKVLPNNTIVICKLSGHDADPQDGVITNGTAGPIVGFGQLVANGVAQRMDVAVLCDPGASLRPQVVNGSFTTDCDVQDIDDVKVIVVGKETTDVVVTTTTANTTTTTTTTTTSETTTTTTTTTTEEPPGSISGTVVDATNASAIAGATVNAMQSGIIIGSDTTDAEGNYNISGLAAGNYTVEASASGYSSSSEDNVQVVAGNNTTQNFALSPEIVSGFRIVLTWGESPSDLDSHTWLPNTDLNPGVSNGTGYHVWYSDEGSLTDCPYTGLDIDDTSSFGPETTTIAQPYNGTYTFIVHDYSNQDDTNSTAFQSSSANVKVYDSTGQIANFDVPTEGNGPYWYVFTLDGNTGVVTSINQVQSSDPSPYGNWYDDVTAGCEA